MIRKQIAVISGSSAPTFEKKANTLLARLEDPTIIVADIRPLTILVIYETEIETNGKGQQHERNI